MKKRFINKQQKHKQKIKILLLLIIVIIILIITFKYLNKSSIKLNDKDFVSIFLIDSNNNIKTKYIKSITSKLTNPLNYLKIEKSNTIDSIPTVSNKEVKEPIIYIYNSHQTEEYSPTSFAEFSINPTVMMADYILEDSFKKNNIQVIIEENNIKNILNDNNWNYSYSYKASRILIEEAIKKHPSIKYFIDIHRDSLTKDKTTIEINGKSYARTIFLIGLENDNYMENLSFTTKINDKLDEKYPNLSKGIYKKGGAGVNGVYNQDVSKYSILIEIGGFENNVTEVYNSTVAFFECFYEVIKENEIST